MSTTESTNKYHRYQNPSLKKAFFSLNIQGKLNLFLCLSLFTLLNKGKAQFNNDYAFYHLYGRSINFNTEYELNSNCINNAFLYKLYGNKFISEAEKNEVRNKLSPLNRIGGHAVASMTAFLGKKESKFSYMIAVKQQALFNTTFSKDLFKLGFYGNKSFLGKTADLSESSFNNYSFNEYKIGLVWDEIDTTHGSLGIALAYLKGQNLFNLKTNKTLIYTAEDGSQIDLETNAQLAINDTSSRRFWDQNGNGISAEFFVHTPYTSRFGKSWFYLSVNNLGFIRWNKKTLYYETDSSFTFKGVYIPSLSVLSDSTLAQINRDSIIANTTDLNHEVFSTNLPTTLFISHHIQLHPKFIFTTGFRHLFHANYRPYYFLEGGYLCTKNIKLTMHTGIGGYGRFNVGLNLNWHLSPHFNIRVGSNSLQGYFNLKKTLGQGLFFSLTYQLPPAYSALTKSE